MPKISRPWSQIEWDTPQPPSTHRIITGGVHLAEFREGSAATGKLEFIEGLQESEFEAFASPLPRARVPNVTPLTEAQTLLSAAAEVEHALLVEYLYAMWSIDDGATASVVQNVAIQEMCHFLTVQNLLLFVGGEPWLARQDQDSPDPDSPLAAYPFTLRPFDQSLLEYWLLTEMPPLDTLPEDQKSTMSKIIDKHQTDPNTIHPVGYIYARLYWLFLETDQPTADWPTIGKYGFHAGDHIEAFPGTGTAVTFQVDPNSEPKWSASKDRGGIFLNIDTRAAALGAIAAIASQGEGSANATPVESHFAAFLDLYTSIDFTQWPATPIPIDPFVSGQPSSDPAKEINRITDSLAAALCRVFDLRYKILLTSIRAALARDRTDPQAFADRAKFATWAFQEMLSTIKSLANTLDGLPRKQGGSANLASAAPTFTLGAFSLPDTVPALDQLLRDLLHSAADAISAALALKPDPAVVSVLQAIQTLDGARTV